MTGFLYPTGPPAAGARRPCPGRHLVQRQEAPGQIRWGCTAGDDNGLITDWQGTPWDLTPAARAARSARLNARLTAALDRLDALRSAPADLERRRVWAEINALRKAVVPRLAWGG